MAKEWTARYSNILVTGLPGVGKTAFARTYAHISQRQFIDFDVFLSNGLKKSIAQIFHERGEEGFRKAEAQVLRRLEKRQGAVVAMGGGTLCREESLWFARSLGLVVYLEDSIERIAKRLWPLVPGQRPILEGCESKEALEARLRDLYEERVGFYESAGFMVNLEHNSLDTACLHLAQYEQSQMSRQTLCYPVAPLVGNSRQEGENAPSSRGM